jgi:uncharacterized protein (DUF1330 family)
MLISKLKVYELALSSIKDEHLNDFREKYIPSIFPVLTEYGGKFIINGIIQNSIAKKFPVKSFAILEWPSIDQFIKIKNDERIVPLIKMRNQYLNFIKEGCFYNVLEDIDFGIPKNKIMTLLLTNRVLAKDHTIRFQWINDIQNSELSQSLYFSNDINNQYNKDKDIEEFIIQLL